MKIVYGSVRRKTVLSLNLHGQTNNAIAYARFNQWIATKHQKHQFLIMIFANAFVTRVQEIVLIIFQISTRQIAHANVTSLYQNVLGPNIQLLYQQNAIVSVNQMKNIAFSKIMGSQILMKKNANVNVIQLLDWNHVHHIYPILTKILALVIANTKMAHIAHQKCLFSREKLALAIIVI